jgi:hypothetical protein
MPYDSGEPYKGMRPPHLLMPIFAKDTAQQIAFSKEALQGAVMALFLADVAWLKHYPNTPLLYESGVVYKPERHREDAYGRTIEYGENWYTIPYVIHHGFGDCEDLASWRSAELRVRYNIPALPDVAVRKLPDGAWRAHVRTRWPDGQIEDPSAKLGMYAYKPGLNIDNVAAGLTARKRQGLGIAYR